MLTGQSNLVNRRVLQDVKVTFDVKKCTNISTGCNEKLSYMSEKLSSLS